MSTRASDGTPTVPRYLDRAETVAPRIMAGHRRRAAETAAGIARLELLAAEQRHRAADLEYAAALRRLAEARTRVDVLDTAALATVLRSYQALIGVRRSTASGGPP
ncbi:hypothetical protein ACIRPH_09635 [Nocardiopsis sp. NPDC101807]|uniref:hypothetical protein n=1 Tax=Nocardiopsis sp. NPDC101807 TaxID=3364339 RepID=UPI0037FF42AA